MDLAREFLLKAEQALMNAPDHNFKQHQLGTTAHSVGSVKNKLLSITQNNLGQLHKL